MPEKNDADASLAKAWVFFERARKVAESNNFDYAIEMYLEGLKCAPDEVQDGHIKLRELALLRLVKGGKKPSMVEKMKLMLNKTPLDKLLGAEHLLAKDPDHLPYAEAMLKAAIEGGYKKTAKWIADLLFQANKSSDHPSFHTYMLLKDVYSNIEQYDRAIAALQCASQLKPHDAKLAEEYQRLSAELTVAKGKYDQSGDFRKSMQDREKQEELQSQEGVIKSDSFRTTAVQQARKALAAQPDLAKNIFSLANVLSELKTDESENEAIKLLEDTYIKKKEFNYKQQANLIRIKQIRRKIKEAKEKLEAEGDRKLASQIQELSIQLKNVELEHYKLCVENYPTDSSFKYEYSVRLMLDKKYDEAIPLLQDSQRDPRYKTPASGRIGLCFYMKGWYADAIDVFTQAINSYEIQDDNIAKELRYNLARSYEHQGNIEEALNNYRRIAQLDYGYKDVRSRIDRLRTSGSGSTSQ